jgi:hypothetical protein
MACDMLFSFLAIYTQNTTMIKPHLCSANKCDIYDISYPTAQKAHIQRKKKIPDDKDCCNQQQRQRQRQRQLHTLMLYFRRYESRTKGGIQ